MRVIIIPADGFVSVDGYGISGLNLSFMDTNIHAVQWYETEGEIEIKDDRGRMVANESIDSIDQFEQTLEVWQLAKQTLDNAQAEAEAEVQALAQSTTNNN